MGLLRQSSTNSAKETVSSNSSVDESNEERERINSKNHDAIEIESEEKQKSTKEMTKVCSLLKKIEKQNEFICVLKQKL